MLSKKAKYGMRALLNLAAKRGSGPVLIKEIAAEERIPQKFLESILVELKTAGVVRSRSGRKGGYELSTHPKDVNLGLIVRLMDGPVALISCVSQTAYSPCQDCPDEQTCLIRPVMQEVRDASAEILEKATLEGMLAKKESLLGAHDGWHFHI